MISNLTSQQPSTSPIFIVGTERSGSNLLRVILNAHSRIAVPHPPHIFKYFSLLESDYGNLNQRDARTRLARDIIKFLKTHIYPWGFSIDPEVLARKAEPPDLLGLFVALYDLYAEKYNKPRWACKSTFMIDHVERVLRSYPAARFLWLVRDPRDVAVSSRNSVFNPNHPFYIAALWRKQQYEGWRLQRSAVGCSLLRIHYEDLINQPESEIKRICSFLSEDFEPTMLEYHTTQAAKTSSSLSESWKNVASPIIANNSNKYRNELSAKEICLIERVTGDLMLYLGYQPDYLSPDKTVVEFSPQPLWQPQFMQRLEYFLLDLGRQVQVETRSLLHDQNHWLRWQRALVWRGIKYKVRLRNKVCRGTNDG